jgi:hypothetical protein
MKNHFFTLCLLFCFWGANAAPFENADSLQISLLTCSPGKIAYEKFGHTAIRVIDKSNGLDIVFNYGIFSFDTEHFYIKFMKGETDYVLGVTSTVHFLPEYAERNSSVTEQILNLTTNEKQRLVEALLINYEPQNRKYRYNFVYDNCSTRAMKIIIENVDGVVIFPKKAAELKTFRAHVEDYAGWNTWLMFGINMLFGVAADTHATKMTSMFLPEILMAEFREAKIIQPESSVERNLVQNEIVLVARNNGKTETSSLSISFPFITCTLLLIVSILVLIWDLKRKRRNRLFNSILFITTGLVGVIVFYFSFISVHPLVQENYNLLWLCPLNLVAGIIIWFRPLRLPLLYYLFIYSIMLLAVLFIFAINWQSANAAFIPLIVTLLTRSLHWITYKRKGAISIQQMISKKKKRHNHTKKKRSH